MKAPLPPPPPPGQVLFKRTLVSCSNCVQGSSLGRGGQGGVPLLFLASSIPLSKDQQLQCLNIPILIVSLPVGLCDSGLLYYVSSLFALEGDKAIISQVPLEVCYVCMFLR